LEQFITESNKPHTRSSPQNKEENQKKSRAQWLHAENTQIKSMQNKQDQDLEVVPSVILYTFALQILTFLEAVVETNLSRNLFIHKP
jgi:cell shape-determining protein MreC